MIMKQIVLVIGISIICGFLFGTEPCVTFQISVSEENPIEQSLCLYSSLNETQSSYSPKIKVGHG
jgi:hypothetical protein